jgi:hypothetical protein
MRATTWAVRREIAIRKARLALLYDTLSGNVPLANQHVQQGSYQAAAAAFTSLADLCQRISKANDEIVQMSLAIEREEARQTDLPLPGLPLASGPGRSA